MDILKIIESYNIEYDMYKDTPMKCIYNGKIHRLKWLYENKYPMTLFDLDYCYCDNEFRCLGADYARCGHCQYARTTTLLDYAKQEKQTSISLWLRKIFYFLET